MRRIVWIGAVGRFRLPRHICCGGLRISRYYYFIIFIKEVTFVKVVLIERPKFWSFILRKMYKIPRLKDECK